MDRLDVRGEKLEREAALKRTTRKVMLGGGKLASPTIPTLVRSIPNPTAYCGGLECPTVAR